MPVKRAYANRGSRLRLVRSFLAASAVIPGLLALSACRSQQREVDYRPGWVRDAEARLQKEPSWETSGPGVKSTSSADGGNTTGSGFFGGRQQATPTSDSQPASEASTPTQTAEPPGVQWGETEITVEVED
ncbi:MAG: hypothetical protein ACLFU4_01130 [Opitutales bacterium]